MSDGLEIIAHRGASTDAPENTLAAFKLAWEQGAHAIELDVHLSKDARLVVIHDADTKRTTGVSGKVNQQTAQALGTLDAGDWKNARWRGEPVPLLADVLASVPQGRRVFIEIKDGSDGVVDALESELGECVLEPQQTVLMSYDFDLVKTLRERIADREIGWVIDRPWKAPRLDKVIARAKSIGLLHLCFSNEWPIDTEMVRQVHEAGLQLNVWTVDDIKRARQLEEAGADGIITNVPGHLIQNWTTNHSP